MKSSSHPLNQHHLSTTLPSMPSIITTPILNEDEENAQCSLLVARRPKSLNNKEEDKMRKEISKVHYAFHAETSFDTGMM